MAVDISAAVTATWPTTETTLSGDTDVAYSTQKALAIARAKRVLYGNGVAIPAEGNIQETAAYWIADQSVVFLIPLARDYYMSKQRLSDSKESATISYYDKLRALNKLQAELEASLAKNRDSALDAISSSETEDAVPAVSRKGMAVDPLDRAMMRGPW